VIEHAAVQIGPPPHSREERPAAQPAIAPLAYTDTDEARISRRTPARSIAAAARGPEVVVRAKNGAPCMVGRRKARGGREGALMAHTVAGRRGARPGLALSGRRAPPLGRSVPLDAIARNSAVPPSLLHLTRRVRPRFRGAARCRGPPGRTTRPRIGFGCTHPASIESEAVQAIRRERRGQVETTSCRANNGVSASGSRNDPRDPLGRSRERRPCAGSSSGHRDHLVTGGARARAHAIR